MYFLWIVSAIFCTVSFCLSTAENACSVPPAMWCDHPTLAQQCGVAAQCQNYNSTVFNRKVKLTLFYEALCPDCQNFITDVLYNNVWKYGRDLVELEFVPYGNARHTPGQNGTYNIACQHGPTECQLNKLHTCAIRVLTDVARWFPFVHCMELALAGHKEPEVATKECYEQLKVKAAEQKKINDCANGVQGDQLEKLMADRTDAAAPDQHEFVPWILINDVSLLSAQMYQHAMFEVLCSWYRGANVPEGCKMFSQDATRRKCAAFKKSVRK